MMSIRHAGRPLCTNVGTAYGRRAREEQRSPPRKQMGNGHGREPSAGKQTRTAWNSPCTHAPVLFIVLYK